MTGEQVFLLVVLAFLGGVFTGLLLTINALSYKTDNIKGFVIALIVIIGVFGTYLAIVIHQLNPVS